MRYKVRSAFAVMIIVGFALPAVSACSGTSQAGDGSAVKPAQIEQIDGTSVSRVILTAEAAKSIGITTGRIGPAAAEQKGTVVPYAAVIYDSRGETWVYQPTADLTFVRQRIVIERIDGDTAVLSVSPPAGTEVVTVGAAELYGTELGVGK